MDGDSFLITTFFLTIFFFPHFLDQISNVPCPLHAQYTQALPVVLFYNSLVIPIPDAFPKFQKFPFPPLVSLYPITS